MVNGWTRKRLRSIVCQASGQERTRTRMPSSDPAEWLRLSDWEFQSGRKRLTCNCTEKSPSGEPDEVKLPVRFGGRGEVPFLVPTLITNQILGCSNVRKPNKTGAYSCRGLRMMNSSRRFF